MLPTVCTISPNVPCCAIPASYSPSSTTFGRPQRQLATAGPCRREVGCRQNRHERSTGETFAQGLVTPGRGPATSQLVVSSNGSPQLPRLSLSAGDHPACRLVVSAIHTQLPGCRGSSHGA